MKYKYSNFVIENFKEFNMPSLILLLGISGSGKSTWIKNNKSKWKNTVVISPDEIRRELTGSINDQSKNSDVFQFVKLLTIDNLKRGKNVVLDATNIDTIYRTPFVDDVSDKVEFKKIALVFYVFREEAKQRIRKDIENGIDRANVPVEIIDSQYNRYMESLINLPKEGFKIVTSWNEDRT